MHRYFQTEPVFAAPPGNINRSQGIIHGITIARIGRAKGHEAMIDKTFLLQVVEMANTRPQGIKARFGHPNMCATALGTYLGRFHNYAFHGERVSADLHLDPTAKATPQGDLFNYVLDMAEQNPDMFGASLVFESANFETSETITDGKKTTQKFFRLKELRATDIVDEPAATDSLFSADSMPAQATAFLDHNPALAQFIFSHPKAIIEFLNNYLNHSDMNLSENIKSGFRRIFSLDTEIPAMDSVPDSPVPSVPDDVLPTETPLTPDDEKSLPSPDDPAIQDADGTDIHQLENQLIDFETYREKVSQLEETQQKLLEAQAIITGLQNRLDAKPTIPSRVTDPQVSANLNTQPKDETGKQILQSIPRDMRYRLRKKQTN